jgi:multicomponent Na+:H+ antiporter subunit G
MELFINILSGLLILSGCFFVLAGTIGILRMPDLYTRIHAASVIDTAGATLIILGLLLQNLAFFDNPIAAVKLIFILLFVYFSAPTASHAIAKMAMISRVFPQSDNGQRVIEETLIIPETTGTKKSVARSTNNKDES